MIIDFAHYSRIFKNIGYFVLLILFVYMILKFIVFFSPFLIGFILASMIEPIIKFLMLKTEISRKAATIISMIVMMILLGLVLTILVNSVFKEVYNISKSADGYSSKILDSINFLLDKINIDNMDLSKEIKSIIKDSTSNLLSKITGYINLFFNSIINAISKIPEITLYTIITILATYFIAADKYYIKDQIEHHIPVMWTRKFNTHFKEIFSELLNYLKAELLLVIISFFIVLIGLYILKFIGFNVGFPLTISIFIGVVDALPILRFRNSSYSMGHHKSFRWRCYICNCYIYFICDSGFSKRIIRT